MLLLIKGTDRNNIIKDEDRGELDRNRRGLIVLFNKNDNYELADRNYDCFSSENEDGGIYYAPELSIDIEKGNLYMHYSHGRYGYYKYTFRFQNSDFKLIGYDITESHGPVTDNETSINFLTKRKLIRKNINETAESGGEVFKETWENIDLKELIKLSDIKNFDELMITMYEI